MHRARPVLPVLPLLSFLTALLTGLAASVTATPAVAAPATTVVFPAGATATRHAGPGFDTCTAPSLSAMLAWAESPYRVIGVYIGGANRTCSQPNLTSAWVGSVSRRDWHLLPIYLGRQAPCTFRENAVEITPSVATAQGTGAARDAVTRAKAVGILPGSGVYADMEHYDVTNPACRTAVLRFLSGWTTELHRQGYLSGVYAHLNSGAQHLTETYESTAYARPDALWIARWDLTSSLTGWAGIPDSRWAAHQRAKQYRGDHDESYGGVTMNIDNDGLDAPVATVAHSYPVTSPAPLNARSGPSTSYPVVRTYDPGATLRVVCQTTGSAVGTTSVWDQLSDGSYVTDYYVGTPSKTGFSPPLHRCAYAYQVTSAGSLNARSGPGTGYPVVGSLPTGSLAWVVCQKAGTTVGTTAVWDRLDDGSWVTDYYVASPSKTSYSAPVPRC